MAIEAMEIGVQATAVVLGTFLSGQSASTSKDQPNVNGILIVLVEGAMMGLSLMTVPLLLDTNHQSSVLLQQWVCLYNYGHRLLPAISITTLLIYCYISFDKWTDGRPWMRYACAGISTVGIIPFTLIVMQSTNNLLFRLEHENTNNLTKTSLDDAQKHVKSWTRMHTARSLFPLTGAIVGFVGLVKEMAGY